MEGNIRPGKVFKANERGPDMEALPMNGDRRMSSCSGWTGFSLCHGKYVLSTWVGTTTFPNHIPLDCNTSPQSWEADSVLGSHHLNERWVGAICWLKGSSPQRTRWSCGLSALSFSKSQEKTWTRNRINPVESPNWSFPCVVVLLLILPVNLLCQTKWIFTWDSWCRTLVRVGASWPVWQGSRSSCLFLDGLLGGKRPITQARGEGIVNHFADDNQDGNLWKKKNNGTLKWTVRRRRQELESFTWMAEGPCSSQRAREVGRIGCPGTDREWEGWCGRIQVFAAGCVSSHLVAPGRHQAAKQLSKRSPFCFPCETFSLLRRGVW